MPSRLTAGTILDSYDYTITNSSNPYIALGNDPKYAAVGAVYFPNLFASGTLISPKWVLTAGHVAQNTSTVTFNLGGAVWNTGNWYGSTQHFINPGWIGTLSAGGNDLGLIRLDTSVAGVAPANRNFGNNELGKAGTFVGFGLRGNGNTSQVPGTQGYKLGLQNVIDTYGNGNGTSFGQNGPVMAADFDAPDLSTTQNFSGSSPSPLGLEGSVAGGDSGGGAFIDINGITYLAGVHSFVGSFLTTPDAGYGDFFAATRVAYGQYNLWIDNNISNNWIVGSNGSFNSDANWNVGSPAIAVRPTDGDIAGFNTAGTYTVTFDGSTVNNHALLARQGTVTLALNGSTYNLTSQSVDGALVVGRYNTNAAAITLTGGTVNSGDVVLGHLTGSNGTLTVGSNATLNVNRDMWIGGSNLGAAGNGTLNVNTSTSQVNVAGTLHVRSTGTVVYSNGTLSAGTLNINGGRVNLTNGAGRVLKVKNLAISNGGKLDLNDNDMIVDYDLTSPIVTIQSYLASGFANGLQSGEGIISTRAKTSPNPGENGKARIGYGEANTLNLSMFDGIAVDNTSVLLKYTYAGDANLDGKVDIMDLNRIATSWNTFGLWTSGDFNYDGAINALDLGLLSSNWQSGVSSPLGADLGTALVSLGLPISVPEPGSMLSISALAMTLLRRRRRQ